MKTNILVLLFTLFIVGVFSAYGQGTVVVVDPTKTADEALLSKADEAVFNKALPAVRKHVAEACTEEVEISGIAHGAFSKPGAKQTIVFYQYCQTGNGLGWVGIVLMENGRVVGNFIDESGWSVDAGSLPDINQNGLDEFTLSYGGGMHQGQGGIGVDIMEFSNGIPKGIGWFQAEKFDDTQSTTVWKVTATPGKIPVYYKQKYFSGEDEKYRRIGAVAKLRLTEATSKFVVVK